MKRALWIAAGLAGALSGWAGVAQAQEKPVYRCPGPPVLYTDGLNVQVVAPVQGSIFLYFNEFDAWQTGYWRGENVVEAAAYFSSHAGQRVHLHGFSRRKIENW